MAHKDKTFPAVSDLVASISDTLQAIHGNLLARATLFRDANMVKMDTKEELVKFFTPHNTEKAEIHGGFALVHWAGTAEDEDSLQKEYGVTMRCIPHGDSFAEEGACFLTGKPSSAA